MRLFKYIKVAGLSLLLIGTVSSCKKDFLKPEISTGLPIENGESIKDLRTAQAVLEGIYSEYAYYYGMNDYALMQQDVFGEDIYVKQTGNYGRFVSSYQYNVTADNSVENYSFWKSAYQMIANANILLDAKDNIKIADAEAPEKARILAEATALRGAAYLYLVRMYGDAVAYAPNSMGVPVVTKADYLGEGTPARNTVKEVYTQVIKDLKDALASNALGSTKRYINEKAAKAILASAYLDLGSNGDAESLNKVLEYTAGFEASELVQGEDYLKGFSAFNNETILGLEYTDADNNGYLALNSFYVARGGYSSLRLNPALKDLIIAGSATENSDLRLSFIGTYKNLLWVNKFPPRNSIGSHNTVIFRTAEMILARAEANARLGNIAAAITDLNAIQTRANATLTANTVTKEAAIAAIMLERRKEFYAEGKRYIDIKRTKATIDKSHDQNWSGYQEIENFRYALPIPTKEIDANSNMQQNPIDLTHI
ncbi:MAG: RagB/SusD family nutrient uptake outer membrane protein [Hyphomicrobiales bacterium]